MTLKAPLNPGHMIPNSMEVYIAKRWSDPLIQLGFYKDQSIASAGETTDDVYSNGTLKKTKDGDKVTVNISTHEMTTEKLEILQSGLVEIHAGTVTSEVLKVNPWDWSFDKDVLLEYSNGDGTAVTVASVSALIDGTETTLTADTDYTVGATIFGATYIKLKQQTTVEEVTTGVLDENAPSTVRLTITYSSTNTAQVMDHKSNALASPFVMVLVNEYEYNGETKKITTYVDNCLANKAFIEQVADSDGTTAGFPVEITGTVIKQDFEGFSMNASS